MCWDCFKKYADEPVVNERVVAACRTIQSAGGDADFSTLLHIIVADMNVDDHWLDLSDPELKQSYDEATDWERSIFDDLAALTEAERATAVAMEWGYIAEDGTLRPDLRVAPSAD